MQEHAQLLKVSSSKRQHVRVAERDDPMHGLPIGAAAEVNRACDEWLRKRGLILPFRPRPYGRKAET